MSLTTAELSADLQPAALAYLRRSPYRNAIPLANLTQLRAQCTVVVARSGESIQGIASSYHDLPFANLVFAVEQRAALPLLLSALADRLPTLRAAAVGTVIPEDRARLLAACTRVESQAIEYQMVVEPETLRPHARPEVRRLRATDLPAMAALAEIGGLVAWRPAVLQHGPAFGAFAADGALLAMATTHFATPDVVEIGNIVTHPAFRRRGLARACTSALAQACFSLASRVYLMVLAENQPAFAAYRGLGFWPAERFVFAQFHLQMT